MCSDLALSTVKKKKNHKLASLQLSGPDGVIRWGTHFNLINQMSSYSPCLFEVKRPWQNHVRRHFSLLTDGTARKVLQQPLNSFRDTFKKTLLWFHFMIPGCFKLIVNLEHNSDVLFKLINASPKMLTKQVVNQNVAMILSKSCFIICFTLNGRTICERNNLLFKIIFETRSSYIWRDLGVELLLLHVRRSQMKWFGHLVRMPPRDFLGTPKREHTLG